MSHDFFLFFPNPTAAAAAEAVARVVFTASYQQLRVGTTYYVFPAASPPLGFLRRSVKKSNHTVPTRISGRKLEASRNPETRPGSGRRKY